MQNNQTHPLNWLISQARERAWVLCLATACSSIAAVLSLAPFYLAYLIIEQLLAGAGWSQLWPLSAFALLLMIMRYSSLLLSVYLAHNSAFHIQYSIRCTILQRLSTMELGRFNDKSSGELKKNLTDDIDRIEVFVAHQLPDLVASVVIPLSTFCLLCIIDVRMAFVSLIPIPLAIICQVALFKDYQTKAQQYHDSIEKLNGCVTEFVRAMPVVRLFGREAIYGGRFEKEIARHQYYLTRWTNESSWPFALFKTTLGAGLLFLVPFGVYFWSQGTLDVASFTLCVLLGVGMLEPLFNLTLLSTYLGQVFEGLRRLIQLDNQVSTETVSDGNHLDQHDVRFNRVDYYYPGHSRKAIDNVSFELTSGSLTAIVGPSGAGKSTIAAMLAGFLPATEGEVSIGGQRLSEMSESQLMGHVAFVFQDAQVFKQSVMVNLTMGKNIPFDDVVSAAKAANAHEFICQLPSGYDTDLGKGIQLSGGQQQRLAIARAMLKDAPIIVLDEPTSHADATNQKLIQAGLSRLIAGKTAIVIAHRLQTIHGADKILVMQNGSLVEQGIHDELLQLRGLYHSMWQRSLQTEEWSLSDHAYSTEVNYA